MVISTDDLRRKLIDIIRNSGPVSYRDENGARFEYGTGEFYVRFSNGHNYVLDETVRTDLNLVDVTNEPDDFFDDEENLYSRELYVGDIFAFDPEDPDTIPEKITVYSGIDDFDNGHGTTVREIDIDTDRHTITLIV